MIGLDVVHVAAAAIWIGGLLQLAVVTPHATRGLAEQQRNVVRSAIARRFSRVALWSVLILAASGGLRACGSSPACPRSGRRRTARRWS